MLYCSVFALINLDDISSIDFTNASLHFSGFLVIKSRVLRAPNFWERRERSRSFVILGAPGALALSR